MSSSGSDINSRFDYLYDNYYHSTRLFFYYTIEFASINNAGVKPEPFSKEIDYKIKQVLVGCEEEIKRTETEVFQDMHIKTIVDAAERFPHAHNYFCYTSFLGYSYICPIDETISMPGEINIISDRKQTSIDEGNGRGMYFITRQDGIKVSAYTDRDSFKDSHFALSVIKELGIYPSIFKQKQKNWLASHIKASTSLPRFTSSVYKSTMLLRQKDIEAYERRRILCADNIVSYATSKIDYGIKCVVSKLLPLISKYKAKEEEINSLLKREQLWSLFDNSIIIDSVGNKYYKEFFRIRYGKENVPLSVFEEVARNLKPLKDYIERQEDPYRRLMSVYPNGVKQFESTHYGIKHSDYDKYEKEIVELEVQSKYVNYPKNQKNISDSVWSKTKLIPSWSIEQLDIKCNVQSYYGRTRESACQMVFASHLPLLDKAFSDSAVPELSKKYPHCMDILNNDILKPANSSMTVSILMDILIPIIDVYLSYTKPVCLVLDASLEKVIATGYGKSAKMVISEAIRKVKNYSCDDVQIKTSEEFKHSHPDHIPCILVDLVDYSETALKKLSELSNQYILSSIISLRKVIREDDLIKIEASRRKDMEETMMRRIHDIKRKYPQGFEDYCSKHGITDGLYLSRYEDIVNSLPSIEELQEYEDRMKQERLELSKINQAKRLVSLYPNVAKEYGFTPSSMIDYDTAKTIISNESSWKEIEHVFYGRFELFGVSKSVANMPHKYFFDYYPKNRYNDSELTQEQFFNQRLIWNFKDGDAYAQSKGLEMVSEFISSSALKQYANKIAFVCVPASTTLNNKIRFEDFSNKICNRWGFINGFDYTHISGIASPKHLGGHGCVKFDAERALFSGKYVLLFDELVTSGVTADEAKRRLESAGARVIGIISLAQTKSAW